MNVALWIAAVLLSVAYLAAGLMKLTQPKAKLVTSMAWAQGFSPGAIKAIGLAEVLGAAGLILPAVTGIAIVLVPTAALCLAGLQLGAALVHARRGEWPMLAINAVLIALALFVAWGRYGPYPF